jgi:hypothetical protein
MYLEKVSAVPKMVSRDFGKLEVRRQRISGEDWAIAGAATAPAAAARPAPFRKFLLFNVVVVIRHFPGRFSVASSVNHINPVGGYEAFFPQARP